MTMQWGQSETPEKTACKSCGEEIYFLKTGAGKWMPVDADTVTEGDELYDPKAGHESHFASCPDSKNWKKTK